MSANDDSQKPPSLRIRELTITNFRTFVEPTTISFCDADGNADAIAVFHGDNGSGKSNALAALDLFFQTASLVLRVKDPDGDILLPWDMDHSVTGQEGDRPIHIKYQDRPPNRSGPMEIEVHFDDQRLGILKAVYTPAGKQVRVRLLHFVTAITAKDFPGKYFALSLNDRDQFLSWLESPRGSRSRGLTIVDARRRQRHFVNELGRSLMPKHLANYLYMLNTSRVSTDRNIWRVFGSFLDRFPSLNGKLFSVELPPPINHEDALNSLVNSPISPSPELVVENPGKTVLGLDELSSGEQHVIVLCAASLLARSAILAIEEPEISLDAKNQQLLRDILEELSQKGIIDQIILESHVALFDGPNVIRFARNENGSTRVVRGPSLDEAKREIARQAKEKGAKQRWVTQDGYTQLPDQMVNELGVQEGGHVWFLKGAQHWEAWHETEVDDFFSGGDSDDA